MIFAEAVFANLIQQPYLYTGVNPINGLQACIYYLVNTSRFKVTYRYSRFCSRIQSAITCQLK